MKKITRAKLEQYLRQRPHHALMDEIIDLFIWLNVVGEDYQQRLDYDTRSRP